MGSASSTGSAHVGVRQGGRCRRVPVAEDVQQLNLGAVPHVMHPDILGNQGARCVERKVVGLCFVWGLSSAEGMQPLAKWAGMKVRNAPTAEPVQLLGAAAAKFMPKKRRAILVEYLQADAARVTWPRMWSFTVGYPEERYSLWDDWVTVWECARLCGGWCPDSFSVVAVCPCVWLIARLRVLVMDEEVGTHTALVGDVLCCLCVHLDAVL